MTDELNAAKGDWLSDFDTKNSEGKKTDGTTFNKAEFISLKAEGTYRIRLVGSYVKFRRHWKPYGQPINTHDNLKAQDPAWSGGFYPSRRFAINIIDRADGKLKILEAGPTIFDQFSIYRKATEIDPAGKDGPDFAITVQIPMADGKPDLLHKKYGVASLQATPFTLEEKAMLCKKDEDGKILMENEKPVSNLWPLARIFKPTPIEKMQELWDALSDEKKTPPKRKDFNQSSDSKSSKPSKSDAVEGQVTTEPITDNVATSSNELFEESGDTGSDSTDLF